MKTIIIDDNQKSRDFLEGLLLKYCPEISLMGKAFDITEGKHLIEQVKPELVFLDVEMPGGTGFELLKQFSSIDFKVIFTTAHEKYALTAIKFSALDYLLKPIDSRELQQAITKVKASIDREFSQLKIQTLLQNINTTPAAQEQKIVLKDKYGMQVTLLKDVIRLEAENSYTQFFIKDQKPLIISKPLKDYEKILPQEQFFRCHKSHIVNMKYLLRYDKREDEILMMQDGSKVPVSRRKLDVLLEKMNSHL